MAGVIGEAEASYRRSTAAIEQNIQTLPEYKISKKYTKLKCEHWYFECTRNIIILLMHIGKKKAQFRLQTRPLRSLATDQEQ